MKIIRIGIVSFYFFQDAPLSNRMAASVGSRFLVLNLKPFFDLVSKIRLSLFPSFWFIGLHDCDSGGRVYYWFKSFAWNGRQLRQLEREWDSASDGPATVRQASFIQYLKFKNRRGF